MNHVVVDQRLVSCLFDSDSATNLIWLRILIIEVDALRLFPWKHSIFEQNTAWRSVLSMLVLREHKEVGCLIWNFLAMLHVVHSVAARWWSTTHPWIKTFGDIELGLIIFAPVEPINVNVELIAGLCDG